MKLFISTEVNLKTYKQLQPGTIFALLIRLNNASKATLSLTLFITIYLSSYLYEHWTCLLLRKLNIDANLPNIEKESGYWCKTFEKFVNKCGDKAPDKFYCLTKYFLANVYEYFSDAGTYEKTLSILDKIYI